MSASDLQNIDSYLDGKSNVLLYITGDYVSQDRTSQLKDYLSARNDIDLYLSIDTILVNTGSFYELNNVSALKTGNNLLSISNGSFELCSDLQHVISNSLAIGSNAFRNCPKLKEVVFTNNSMNTVPGDLFYGCSSLEKVSFAGDIKNIHDMSFYGCANLKNLYFENTHNEPVISGDHVFTNVPLDCTVYVAEDYPSDTFGPFTNVVKVEAQ